MRWLAFGRGVGVLLLGVRPTRCRTVDDAKPQGVDSTHQDCPSGGRSPAGCRRAGSSLAPCSAGAVLDLCLPNPAGLGFPVEPRRPLPGARLARRSPSWQLGNAGLAARRLRACPPATRPLTGPASPCGLSDLARPRWADRPRRRACWPTTQPLVGPALPSAGLQLRPPSAGSVRRLVGLALVRQCPPRAPGSWLTVRWSGAARALGARPIGEKPDAVGRCRRAAGLGRASLSLLVVGGWSGFEPGGRSWTGLGSDSVRPTRSGFTL